VLSPQTKVRLSQFSKYAPAGRTGKPRHVSAFFRYAKRGVRGVKLRVEQHPDGLYTCLEWWDEFIRELTASRSGSQKQPASRRTQSNRQNSIEGEIEQVRKTLRGKKGGAQ
jgi:hypothetical protein